MNVILTSLYEDYQAWITAFRLLEQRRPEQNISHREMPTWPDHCRYVQTQPHPAWYGIRKHDNLELVGCIYLRHQREIGVGILKEHQRQGYAEAAILGLMDRHPGRFLANVAPGNLASARLWEKLGFRHIQNTYAREPS